MEKVLCALNSNWEPKSRSADQQVTRRKEHLIKSAKKQEENGRFIKEQFLTKCSEMIIYFCKQKIIILYKLQYISIKEITPNISHFSFCYKLLPRTFTTMLPRGRSAARLWIDHHDHSNHYNFLLL